MNTRNVGGVLLVTALALGACRSRTDASRANFRRGMEAYLRQRGDLCVGRPSWPIDVPEADSGVRASDALQLPVLERLGLATSTVLPVRVDGRETPFRVRRFRLTAAGREHYIDRRTRAPVSPDDSAGRADFCVARLGLRDVESWDLQLHGGAPAAVVSYTYTVEAPAWTRDPGFQRTFPAVARVLRGAGTAKLVEGFTLTADGWTATEL